MSRFCLSLPCVFYFLSFALLLHFLSLSHFKGSVRVISLCHRSPSLFPRSLTLFSILYPVFFPHFFVNFLHLRLTSYLQCGPGWVMFISVVLCSGDLSPLTSHLCLSSFLFLLPLKPLFISDMVPGLLLLLFVIVSLPSPLALSFFPLAWHWYNSLLSRFWLIFSLALSEGPEQRCQGMI